MNGNPDDEIDILISALVDGKLSDQQRLDLNRVLRESPAAVERYHELLDNHEALCAIYPGEVFAESLADDSLDGDIEKKTRSRATTPLVSSFSRRLMIFASAAILLIAVGLAGYLVGTDPGRQRAGENESTGNNQEQTVAGHAMLHRSVSVQWAKNTRPYRDGDVIPNGRLRFDAGIAEIEFFCGATLTVEGPADLEVQSDWSVKVSQGRLRARVPPAARGFVVHADETEIVDLGTEFALDIDAENARVEVLDGEVALKGGMHDGIHLTSGQQRWLGQSGQANPDTSIDLSLDVEQQRDDAEAQRFAAWNRYSRQRAEDERLVAYYRIANMPEGRTVPNSARERQGNEATLVGPVERTNGRFGQPSTGLEFDRIGARARTRIDQRFEAFTFATWVRIDSLDHVYNALFMSDGYETGELHWQIREDGSLMFSVMVDDTQEVRHFSQRDNAEVKAAGLAKVYYSEPFWDISQSGRWFHLVAVYDPIGRRVTQYVNGQRLSDERIPEKFYIEDLKIGPAEIGNWGQPFRKTPWFAVRNLNGTIDELAIYNAALEEEEIREIYEQGKPLGY
ncbi:hypothetical protein FYK55_02965 [Roseiconus nitratireducens]|uniref:FecR protein domain-containing protein n=1 Tax=Roseiconus nitratireducens TaxID=2605748 RepID=A0A5M6DHZ8_9BACT|nr:LamG-like jellyroll fold domain-containing protein [Roseiconus nitratireducens]KAA5545892.1 hypothetical protein FYK55_02965 [Roseiconus nitratireducens]